MRDDINIYAIIKEKVTFLLSPELRPTELIALTPVYSVDPLVGLPGGATFMINSLVSYVDTCGGTKKHRLLDHMF